MQVAALTANVLDSVDVDNGVFEDERAIKLWVEVEGAVEYNNKHTLTEMNNYIQLYFIII